MQLEAHDSGVVNITAEQLRTYTAKHKEAEYLLIDVREAEEYQAAHVPGAKLIPLLEIDARADELRQAPEQLRIFYCRSGARSGRAAAYLAQRVGLSNVFNLAGGMMAYDGHRLPDFPNLRAFDDTGTVPEILRRAIDLEKGADRMYSVLQEHLKNDPAGAVIGGLAKAERAHGRAVYNALKTLGEQQLDDFAKLYDELPGDILESGQSFEQAVEQAEAVAQHGTASLLELALELELRAYDLYRSLAHQAEQEDLRSTFLDLADQEKRHARTVLRTLAGAAPA